MTARVLLLVAILPFLADQPLSAQSGQTNPEQGLPFFSCTQGRETGGTNQIWTIEQDDRGIVYVGSNGISEYDGASWRHTPNDGHSAVRWLDHDGSGRIYAAGGGEFGYMAPDSIGRQRYHSLLEFVPEEHRTFDDIWSVHATPKGVYFLARERLFLATPVGENWTIKIWNPEERFLYGFLFNGTYYVHQQSIGLTRMVGDALLPVAGGEQFGGERMQVMLPDPHLPGGFILGTFNRGLFRYDGSSFTPWKTEVDQYLRENTLYKAAILKDGTFALATLAGGIVLLATDGSSRGILNTESNLPGNDVLSVFTDQSGLLWAAPQGWICQIDVPSPLTRYDASMGLDGDLTNILRHEGVLYITTQNAVQYLDPAMRRLRYVHGFAQGVSQSWQLLSVEEDLLVVTGTGLYQIRGDLATPVVRNVGGVAYSPFDLHRSMQDSNRVFVALMDGLASVYREGPGRWRDEGRVDGISHDVRIITETSPGLFWLGTLTSGAVRLRMSADARIVDEVEYYGKESGFQTASGMVGELGGTIVGGDVDRIVRFDEESERFVVDSLLSTLVHGQLGGGGDVKMDAQGVHYVSFGSEVAALHWAEDGSYTMERTPFLRFADSPTRAIYPEPDGVIWFGTDDNLIRYDPSVEKTYDADFAVLIRQVSTSQGRELYAGDTGAERSLRVAYAENNIRFHFAAAVYEKPTATTFQTMLEGFDEDWSDWTTETRREYTNIPPGEYTLRVRGRNAYEQPGREAALALAILPPWYRSLWAYGLYGLIFAGFVVATDRVQRRRLVKKERERSAIEQAELRAVAAEAQSSALEAENQKKKNIELLSRIGRDITSTLSIEQIIDTVYEHVNVLMDATVFGIGLYDEVGNRLEFPAMKERGETLPFFVNDLSDDRRIAVWCFKHQKEVVIQDLETEWSRYLTDFVPAIAGDDAASILYLPLVHLDKPIGVITAQSFEKGAYSENHVNILRNLATYTAIALDNADAYRRLNSTVHELNETLEDLKTTQEQLVTQEKMASLGALTAGIAHEVKNPLNFVNNFAELVVELTEELREELAANRSLRIEDIHDTLEEILLGLKSNARQIVKHGKRADDIVRGMMQHASGGSGERYEVSINGFVEEYVHLAYHGMRARPDAIAVDIGKELAPDAGNVLMVPQEIGRVLINLLNNAFDALREHSIGGDGRQEARVTVRTRRSKDRAVIEVQDNGPGVPDHVREKIFEPFFTTKAAGSGTGLGLSLSYDVVVHGHGGELSVANVEGGGACFTLSLPA